MPHHITLYYITSRHTLTRNIFHTVPLTDNLSAVVLDNDNDDESADLNPMGTSSKGPDDAVQERLVSQITPLGFHLAALPINPRIGKLILFGKYRNSRCPFYCDISMINDLSFLRSACALSCTYE